MFHGTGSNQTKDEDMDLDVNRIVQEILEGVYHDLSEADEEEDESKFAPAERDDGTDDEINHVTKLVLQESLAGNNQETNVNQSEGSDDNEERNLGNYSDDGEAAPREHTKEMELTRGPLSPETQELAHVVAKSILETGTCRFPKQVHNNKVYSVKRKKRSAKSKKTKKQMALKPPPPSRFPVVAWNMEWTSPHDFDSKPPARPNGGPSGLVCCETCSAAYSQNMTQTVHQGSTISNQMEGRLCYIEETRKQFLVNFGALVAGEKGTWFRMLEEMKSTGEPLSPEMQELAQIVAKCFYERDSRRLHKKVVHNKIESHESATLEQFWKIKSKNRSELKLGYGALLFGDEESRFREYRDRVLDEMVCESDVEDNVGLGAILKSANVNNEETTGHNPEGKDGGEANEDAESTDNLDAKTQMELAKPKGLTSDPLSPEMEDLARIVATCLYERGTYKVPKEIVHNKIESHGSARLKQFWKVKSKLRSVRNYGYANLLSGKAGRRFREYRERLLEEMVSEGGVEDGV